MKTGITILLTVLACAATNLAAQSTAYVIQTNLPGVTAAGAEPPAWLDPLTATDADLATYGFPPRPDSETQPERFRSWQRAMAHSKHFVVPDLKITNKVHGPAHAVQVQNSTAQAVPNWSAVVVQSGASSFGGSSFHTISAEYVVPVPAQACANGSGTGYSSSWVGIDGSIGPGASDVLQGGTESDCAGDGLSESRTYYAWYEWFSKEGGKLQGPEVQIGFFAVSPGDDIWIEVWNESATQGYVYILDYNTDQAVNLSIQAPSGTQLIGNTAEWVVERPLLINGSLTTLTTLADYVSDYFSNCYADTYRGAEYTPGSASAVLVTMLDNDSVPISSPTVLGANAIQFQYGLKVKKAVF